jgi:hypothetical protein
MARSSLKQQTVNSSLVKVHSNTHLPPNDLDSACQVNSYSIPQIIECCGYGPSFSFAVSKTINHAGQ